MLYNLLTDTARYRSVGIGEAALYALLGFIVVFVGIAFLIFVVWLVGKIMTAIEKKPTKPQKIQQEQTVAAISEEEEVSEETVAVIMAALMAYYEKNNPKCEFKVKRIKRI